LLLQYQSSSWELRSFTFASMQLFGSKAKRRGRSFSHYWSVGLSPAV
jgi:hypothetical protein